MDAEHAEVSTPVSSHQADGNLLALLVAGGYTLFTLLPGSSTLMVTWPWVALWQATLLLPILWVLWQGWHKPLIQFRLGNGFDWWVGLGLLGLVISTLATDFPQPARWQIWAALGSLATLYGLGGWLTAARAQRLLKLQGGLAVIFMIVSLGLWTSRIYLPELSRLSALKVYGASQGYNFNLGSLRNWYPIGHQNYVAGYLVLVLPLLVGLVISDRSRWRWLWGIGIGLNLMTLYTTNSRAGILALGVLLLATLIGLLFNRRVSKPVLVPAALVGLGLLALLGLANPRFQETLAALAEGRVNSGQLTYRIVTNAVGGAMGGARPWAGQGPGSVPLVYQRYRPFWAGQEAEMQYQLHSTPAQLWGELGCWGILLPIAGAGLLAYALWRQRQRPRASDSLPPSLIWSLVGGLGAYGIFGLTDYQLDIIAISGVMIVYLAVLLFELRPPLAPQFEPRLTAKTRRGLIGLGVGMVLAMGLWLIPIHRAWAASASGFLQIQRNDFNGFVQQLTQAHKLAPWEPYYPFQLGWAIGDLSYQTRDQTQAAQYRQDAIHWFELANQVSPYQEFGHSNLGWLQIQTDPVVAITDFTRSAQLMPGKMGVFFGLGYSLLLTHQPDLATEALVLEIARHPLLLTSPVWRIGQFAAIYPQVLDQLEQLYSQGLESNDDRQLQRLLYQLRGSLRWWTNDLKEAASDWDQPNGTPISRAVLATAMGTTPNLKDLPDQPGKYALKAWYDDPSARRQWLQRAWVTLPEDVPQIAPDAPPQDQIDSLETTMNQSQSFEQWLKQNAPTWQPRSERLGFGLLNRHNDGLTPADFYPRLENLPMTKFFAELMPSPTYMPSWDEYLQPHREALLRKLRS